MRLAEDQRQFKEAMQFKREKETLRLAQQAARKLEQDMRRQMQMADKATDAVRDFEARWTRAGELETFKMMFEQHPVAFNKTVRTYAELLSREAAERGKPIKDKEAMQLATTYFEGLGK